ncbi:MAG: hypothetical protein AAFU03_11095, partial [Bacteroidota bacterium]
GGSPKGSYYLYEGIVYIQEEVVLFRDIHVERISYYREVVFKARYVAKSNTGGEYDWLVYIERVRNINPKYNKKDIRQAKKKFPKEKMSCDFKEGDCDPNFVYERVPAHTYAIPGIGWRHFNPQRKFHPWPAVSAIVGFGIGYGAYSKLRSDDFYGKHLGDRVLTEQRENYLKANENNHRFIVASGVAAFFWLASDGLILLKDSRNKRIFNKRFKCQGVEEVSNLPLDYQPQPIRLEPTLLPDAIGGVGLRVTMPITH